ncbi:MAG: hypothetical protein IT478_17310 [Xanthomonadales bacterium]|nr:hypothetical protein [Xanthomonadales bacterium]
MIYEAVDPSAPIRQGDIFVGMPRIDLSLSKLSVVEHDGTTEAAWSDLLQEGKTEVVAVVGLRPVMGIVLTQDCDAIRAPQITLCEVRPFAQVDGIATQAKDAKSWVSILTKQSRQNLKWFYLPPDSRFAIGERMAADFRICISVLREDIESLRHRRVCRFNAVADEHFLERLAEFFRRYPVDEWYPFNREELRLYTAKNPDTTAFPWQAAEDSSSAAS